MWSSHHLWPPDYQGYEYSKTIKYTVPHISRVTSWMPLKMQHEYFLMNINYIILNFFALYSQFGINSSSLALSVSLGKSIHLNIRILQLILHINSRCQTKEVSTKLEISAEKLLLISVVFQFSGFMSYYQTPP